MHKEGARGLAVFGYEPESDAPSRPRPPLDGYRCSLTPADCAAMGSPFAKAGRGAGNLHVTKGSTEVRLLKKLLGEWGLLGHLGCDVNGGSGVHLRSSSGSTSRGGTANTSRAVMTMPFAALRFFLKLNFPFQAVDSEHCTFAKGKDYPGRSSGDLVAVSTPDAASCCADCRSHDG